VQVEHVARICLATGGSPQEQRHLAVGPGVFRKVIVDHQGIATLLHDLLTNGAASVGGQVLQGCRIGGVGCHDDGVVHGAVLLENGHDLGDACLLLADGDVDTDHVALALIDDGIHGDRGLAGLAVADDQLPLAAANWDHGVDSLDPGLDWGVDGLAQYHARGDPLDGAGLGGVDRALPVDRLAQGVDHAADHLRAHGDLHNAAGGANLVTFLDVSIGAKDGGAHALLFQVEGQSHGVAGELQQFASHCPGEAMDSSDAVAYLDHGSHVDRGQHLFELLYLLLQDRADLVCANCHTHLLVMSDEC